LTTSQHSNLPFKPPFDWPRLLRFFGGRATPGVEAVEDGAYRRAIDWAGDSGTLTVRLHPRKRCIVANIEGPASRHADALATPIARMFDLHADPKKIGNELAADPWLAPLIEAVPGLRVPGAWSGFELVVRAIVGQQVSVKAATTIIGRLVQRAGEAIEGHPHENTAWRFPTPAALAAVDLEKIGMPGKRVAALQGFAQASLQATCRSTATSPMPTACAQRCSHCLASVHGPSSMWRCAHGVTPTPGPHGTSC
jgi:3-methyladenine DNA glycosylase/8-oxoguanine DNA glycosylase